MGQESNIQWTEATYNPWHGCKKVSAGCKFCYMFRDKEKYGQNGSIVLKSKTKFNDPLKWKEPKLIFTCSWSDFFIEEADEWRPEVWDIIKKTPHHTYQILTKRPERIATCLPSDWGDGYPNVWLGVSIENQDNVGRLSYLEEVPAAKRFISFEPLIGELTSEFVGMVDWIIIGGESGNNTGYWRYRECKVEWIENIVGRYQQAAGPNTKIFVKQMGTHLSKVLGMSDSHGGNMDEFPLSLQIREIPTR